MKWKCHYYSSVHEIPSPGQCHEDTFTSYIPLVASSLIGVVLAVVLYLAPTE